jgi:hypothetical protein
MKVISGEQAGKFSKIAKKSMQTKKPQTVKTSRSPKQTTPKKLTQKDKQERGVKGESLLTDSLRAAGLWSHKLVNAGYGTVFDKLIIPPGGGYAIEVKTRIHPRIEYSKISANERRGLQRFVQLVGRDYAFIIGIWLTEDTKRMFLIPWVKVRDAVCSGQRGSINMLDFPELPRMGSGWDMDCFIWGIGGREDEF